MAESDYSRTDGDVAAGQNVAMQVRPCRFCDAPIEQKGKRVKEFCNSAHRAAYREQEHQKALALTVDAIENAEDAVGQALAQLGGAKAMLQKFQKKKNTNE